MAAIEVEKLTYTYPGGSAPALQDISFTVEKGELAAVVGANGAGKSTLMLALAGLIPALFHGRMEGMVRTAGMDTSRHTPGQFAGKVGLVLQNPANQLSSMRYTIYEEVAFGLENLGIARAEMPERIEHALEMTGLTGLEERSPFNLSGGQQQRLALASVLVLEPPILLLDEPTAMLDPHGSKSVFEVVSKLAREGATVLVASHSLEWVAAEAARVIVLSEGECILNDSPEEVLTDPLLEEASIGRLRYTRAAEAARQIGLWPSEKPLPVSLQKAAQGFNQSRMKMEGMGG